MRLEDVPKVLDLCYGMRVRGYEPITPHLIGPPGIGKSTVVKEWSQRKVRELGLEWHDYDVLSPKGVDAILQEPDRHFIFADKRLTSMDPTDFGIPREVTINGRGLSGICPWTWQPSYTTVQAYYSSTSSRMRAGRT